MLYKCPRVSSHFPLGPTFFSYRRPFWGKCTERCKDDGEHHKVIGAPHICVTSDLRSQVSFFFTLRTVVLKLQAISDMCIEWTLQLRSKICQGPQVPTFQLISLYGQLWSSSRPFWHSCTKRRTNDIEHKRSNVLYMCYNWPWVHNFTPCRSMLVVIMLVVV